jgi:hypothetical protein
MADDWTINAEKPAKSEQYSWRTPKNSQEAVEQTTAPGDLNIKPGDITLKVTLSPKRSGVQHGADDWDYINQPDDTWYIIG